MEFEKHLDAQGFPESYRPYLRSLHKNILTGYLIHIKQNMIGIQ